MFARPCLGGAAGALSGSLGMQRLTTAPAAPAPGQDGMLEAELGSL